jgi:hypothetical protein
LWRQIVGANPVTLRSPQIDRPRWPVIVDLNHDRRPEVILPCGSDESALYWNRHAVWGEFAVWDGPTGVAHWQQRVTHADWQIDHFANAPDCNDDGYREVVTATIWGTQRSAAVFIDCWSGRSGEPIWRTSWTLPAQSEMTTAQLGPLEMWQAGEDGSPTLLVPLVTGKGESPATTQLILVSLASGAIQHVGRDVHRAEVADIDGDGTEDLCLRYYHDIEQGMSGGTKLSVVRGTVGEPVRRLGQPLYGVSDLNGDGADDLVQFHRHHLEALDARSGASLWRTEVPDAADHALIVSARNNPDLGTATSRGAPTRSADAATWDFDGDQTLDLLIHLSTLGESQRPLLAVSGRTGAILWRAPLARRFQQGQPFLQCVDREGDGQAEILYYGYSDWGQEQDRTDWSSSDGRLWCALFSARDGRLLWKQPLTATYGLLTGAGGSSVPYNFVDRVQQPCWTIDGNGDGIQDVIVVAEPSPAPPESKQLQLELRNGRDGAPVWQQPLAAGSNSQSVFRESSRVTVADLDGDDRPEVVTLELISEQQRQAVLTARRARDGHVLWVWKQGVAADFELNPGHGRSLVQAEAVHLGSDGLGLALALRGPDQRETLWVLDGQGAIRHEYRLENQTPGLPQGNRLWVADVNGDGRDEIALHDGQLCIVQVPRQGAITQLVAFSFVVHDARAEIYFDSGARDTEAQLVVVRPDSLIARSYSAVTGQTLWTCQGPLGGQRAGDGAPTAQVMRDATDRIQGVLWNIDNQLSVCRLVSYAPGVPHDAVPLQGLREGSASNPAVPDPRLARSLPWMAAPAEAGQNGQLYRFAATVGLLSLTLIVLPGWMVRRLAQGRWSLGTWLGMPAVAAFIFVALRWPARLPLEPGDLDAMSKLRLALFGAPVLFGLFYMLRQTLSGRLRPIAVSVTAVAIASAAYLATGLAAELSAAPLKPGETIAWHGWYWSILAGVYLASCAYCVTALLLALWRAVRRLWIFAQGRMQKKY